MDFTSLVGTTQQEASVPTPAPVPVVKPEPSTPVVEDSYPVPEVAGVGVKRQLPWQAGGGQRYNQIIHNVTATGGSVRQAMIEGGLDWNVELVTAYADWLEEDGVSRREAPGYAVQRQDNGHILGMVGERYTPVQNRRLAEFTDTLIDQGGSSLVGMGEVRNGRHVFGVVRLDGDIRNNPQFPEDTEGIGGHLIVGNTHDGTGSMFASVMFVRWACSNGLIGVVPGINHTVKIRHTGDVEAKLEEAQRVLALATGYTEQLVTIRDEMLLRTIPTQVGSDILTDVLVPKPKFDGDGEIVNQKAITRGENVRDSIRTNWLQSDNLEAIRHTGWGLYNAVTEWDQHIRSRSARAVTPMERVLRNSQHYAVDAVRDRVLALN